MKSGSRGSNDDKKALGVSATFFKAFKKNCDWNDKDELLDVLYWGRQIVSLFIGVCWGLIPMKGLLALIIYVGSSTFLGHFYVTTFQSQDADNYGGFWELAKEGFGAAFATFMISWITIYSAVHFDIDS